MWISHKFYLLKYIVHLWISVRCRRADINQLLRVLNLNFDLKTTACKALRLSYWGKGKEFCTFNNTPRCSAFLSNQLLNTKEACATINQQPMQCNRERERGCCTATLNAGREEGRRAASQALWAELLLS